MLFYDKISLDQIYRFFQYHEIPLNLFSED